MPSSCRTASTMPPRAVPSSLVSTIPVTSAASRKLRACAIAFWPVVASSTRSVSCGAPGSSRAITRRTLPSSAMRLVRVCRRPAVSTSTTSMARASAAFMPSKATAEGSAPGACRTRTAPVRSAQTASCSMAAARKVSAATRSARRPASAWRAASLPMVVVLPTPLTPVTSTTHGRAVGDGGAESPDRREDREEPGAREGENGSRLRRFPQPDGDDLRDACPLHRDAVERVGHLHRPAVVGDEHELRSRGHLADELIEATDVRLVERRVDLVEQAEGCGADQEQRQDERRRGERLLTAREKPERLELLACRLDDDLDPRLASLFRRDELEARLAVREELGKDLGELLVRRGEGLLEALARGAGELGDRAPEVVERALEVGPLCDEELAPRAQLLELAGGGGIDVAEACEPRAQRPGVLRAFRVLAVVLDDHVGQRLRAEPVPLRQLRREVLEREPPLGEGDLGSRALLPQHVEPLASARLGGVVGGQPAIGLGERAAQPVPLERQRRGLSLGRLAFGLRRGGLDRRRVCAARRLGCPPGDGW